MLRISNLGRKETGTTLRLDGQLSGVWIEELRRSCEAVLAEGQMLVVDCGGVSYSSPEGIALMRGLLSRNVSLKNCSPFLQLQLKEEPAF